MSNLVFFELKIMGNGTSATPSSLSPSTRLMPPPSSPRSQPDAADSVPVMFRWAGGGQRVFLTGTFTEWSRQGIPMVRSGQEFYQIVNLPRGVHEFKFVVDNEWKHSQDLAVVQDSHGIVNNVVDTLNYTPYESLPFIDPLDAADISIYVSDIQDAPSNEPPNIPALLLKAGLIATPLVNDLACSSVLLLPYFVGERTKPLIPGHSLCMHVFQDEKTDCSVVNLRYRQKISTQLVVSGSARGSDGHGLRALLGRSSRRDSTAGFSSNTD
jgi:hypothetical protein